jgi:hypothetical protein
MVGDQQFCLECSIYIMGCSAQPSRAIRYSSMALALTRFLLKNTPKSSTEATKKLRKNVADALFLRAKALLTANRPQLAKRDVMILAAVDKSRSVSKIDVHLLHYFQ